ncbi:MAG TPA: endonuclease [candidate division Zixibacteria bacterium]|nr:endonuclease [candidate division Zixibacteria bacterium]
MSSSVALPPTRRLLALTAALALLAGLFPGLPIARTGAQQAPGAIFISEFHYDNASTDVGEFVEVTAPAGTDLSGWQVVRYNGSTGQPYTTPGPVAGQSETFPPGTVVSDQTLGYGTVVIDYSQDGLQNGSPDGIALVDGTGTLVEFLSYEGTFTATSGPAAGVQSTDVGAAEPGTASVTSSVARTGLVPGGYTWGRSDSNTKGAVNPGLIIQGTTIPEGGPPTVSCGPALAALEGSATTRTITATDPDGTVTSIAAVVEPAEPGIALGATTPATEPGGEASAVLTVASTVPAGTYTVTVTATTDDPTPETGTCTLSVTVTEVLTIGEVQGSVDDDDNGATHRSPFAPPSGNGAGQTVFVRGVVTQRGRFPTEGGDPNYGFWLQSRVGATDGDPNSSDGIFVFIGRFPTVLRLDGGPAYFPVVGDQIVLQGRVTEFFSLTELGSPRLVAVEETGIDVNHPDEIQTLEATPPDDLAEANRFWERGEGMRWRVEAGAKVVAARDVFPSTHDAEMWVVDGDHPIANRADPYQRIVYRDPHPLDDVPGTLFDNGNGMRIMLQSHGLKWLAASDTELIAPANTYDTITNQLTGALYFAFGKYGIEVEQQPQLEAGVDPAQNAPPSPADPDREFSSSDYNVQNLYDFRDDPNDGCDFAGNPGCPGVDPPFDYVPASQADYQQHLANLAAQIAGPMHAPDLLMVQEAEDQDICWVEAASLVCGTTDNADGRPDTLQELALAISAAGGPTYEAVYDRNGADDRGIVSAFLYRTDTVELLPPDPDDPVLGDEPSIAYGGDPLPYNSDVQNPKSLNAALPDGVPLGDGCDELPNGRCVYTRDPLVGKFRVWRDGIGTSVFTELYAISNHFSSTPDSRVAQRTEQARYNAAIAEAILAADPDARIISAGDFNVFPRPDDPFAPPNTSDQLGPMYEAGLHNLWDVLVAEVPRSAYSYSFSGQVQTLDMQWADDNQFADLVQVRAAHLNADFAAGFDGDVARGASDHDPQLARWNTDVTFERLHALVDYYVTTGQLAAGDAFHFHDRLDKAEAFLQANQRSAAVAQLQAFGNQAYDFASPTVAGAMEKEADRLAGLLTSAAASSRR